MCFGLWSDAVCSICVHVICYDYVMLCSVSSGPQSDVVVRVLDVFVIQACFVLCVPDFVPMQYAVYVLMLVDMFMLCYVQSVPDFGPMQGTRS